MALAPFVEILRDAIGLNVTSIGIATVTRAVRERQQACDLDDLQAYLGRLKGSADELQALIEAAVVPETWFFRDPRAFEALAQWAKNDWLVNHPEGALRLLSLPCSTGEEPYSIAIALLDAGVPAHRFRVDAVDVSHRAVTHARRGVYGRHSFRGGTAAIMSRRFQGTDDGCRVSDTVKGQVDFQQGNLFGPSLLSHGNVYDVVFCRNVLIYFDRRTQDRAVQVLARLVKPNGWLFVGSSETAAIRVRGDFVPSRMPMAFAFRRYNGEPRRPGPRHAPSRRRSTARPTASPAIAPGIAVRRPASPQEGERTDATVDAPCALDEARALADTGSYAEAMRRCEDHIRRQGPSADALHLLGLVRDAAGDGLEALVHYRGALYLDPNHEDTLIHFALLLDRLDRKTEADALRVRVRRLPKDGRRAP